MSKRSAWRGCAKPASTCVLRAPTTKFLTYALSESDWCPKKRPLGPKSDASAVRSSLGTVAEYVGLFLCACDSTPTSTEPMSCCLTALPGTLIETRYSSVIASP